MLAVKQVRRILDTHDLERWIATWNLRIDSLAVPHSDPVLMLNTRYLHNDSLALAVFVHEQIHWLLSPRIESVTKAIVDLERVFPKIPDRPPKGAHGKFSTYLHLIVNYIEYHALKKILGPSKARSILEKEQKSHYSWIYRTVLTREKEVRTTVRRHKILLDEL
jgi:hypothetical protein